ncbi:MAG: methionine gamma-lyase family protein [Clostridiaceae bacterium]|jgi:cystathionine beta-lyase family protein involved in aluminum resistance|nr:methionine gamma-lyase family protein [Clostridiaceae bacterium]
MNFSEKNNALIKSAEQKQRARFEKIDKIAYENQKKVLEAFQKNGVAARHFAGTTGYGYDDIGRDTLSRLYADIFGAEAALVSPNIVSGTHALTLMLFGILRPGDIAVSITGKPYDTLEELIYGENVGSLADFGVKFDFIPLKDNTFDWNAAKNYLSHNTVKLIFIQRSRGYEWRDALSIGQIAEIIRKIRSICPNVVIAVDNCYGEFVAETEPVQVGADIMAGSLIKNAGGGFAPTGGYIAGKAPLVELVSYRLTSPSIGAEVGSYAYGYLPFYQGAFVAPVTVAGALKGSVLAGQVFSDLGYKTLPAVDGECYDIIRSIEFFSSNDLIEFCRGIQHASPVDSNLTLEPWDMPGYRHQVIMAAGTFIQGSSIELSADSPIKAPYIAYMQGGLSYEHIKIAVQFAAERIINKNR